MILKKLGFVASHHTGKVVIITLELATMLQGVSESSYSHTWNLPSTEGIPPRLGVNFISVP